MPYRETIKGKAEAHGRHKKQTGGHGQFADCRIRVEPLPRGADFEFVDDIYGGSIPRNFIPAVEKGIQEARRKGFLAGYPMVDFRVTLYDGQYHDVDSSELAFKIAGALAYKEAMEKARPTLLEPIMNVEVSAPNEYVGDLMGDLSSRRGHVQGMETAVRRHAHPGAGPDGGDADLRRPAAVDHAGPRLVPPRVRPLRRGPARRRRRRSSRSPRRSTRRRKGRNRARGFEIGTRPSGVRTTASRGLSSSPGLRRAA